MRVVIQKVKEASVVIDDQKTAQIGHGLLVFLGITNGDTKEDVEWLTRKIIAMRLFEDEAGMMNRSLQDVSGEVLLVSQFTLFASTKKGNRPSYIKAARPDEAIPLYEYMIAKLKETGVPVATGEFGADMEVSLINDGPVTITMDSQNKE